MIVYIPYFFARGGRNVMNLGDFPKPQGVDVVWYDVKFHQSEARVGSLSPLIFPSYTSQSYFLLPLQNTEEAFL